MAYYTAIFEQSSSGTWAGYVPDLPVILAMGDTRAEAEANMREVIELWIEETKADGLPIPAPSAQSALIEVAA